MALDIFGNTLYVGDVVVSTRVDEDGVSLAVYEVDELVDDTTVLAVTLSGEYIGSHYYLLNTNERCALLRNPYKDANLRNGTILH